MPLHLQLNNTLSLGQHRVWKRMAVKWTEAKAGDAALDVCCGSGDLAFLLAAAVGPSGKVKIEGRSKNFVGARPTKTSLSYFGTRPFGKPNAVIVKKPDCQTIKACNAEYWPACHDNIWQCMGIDNRLPRAGDRAGLCPADACRCRAAAAVQASHKQKQLCSCGVGAGGCSGAAI